MTRATVSSVSAILLAAFAALSCAARASGQERADDVVGMIGELLKESDRDMRALAFQQVRTESPGVAATRAFAALLPTLPPETQAGLLDALADRRDREALSAVKGMLKSDHAAVRAAALRAMGTLGNVDDVPFLAEKAAVTVDAEQLAARQSLVLIQGTGANAAIAAGLGKGGAGVRRELLSALAARGAREVLPTVTTATRDPDPSVRLAAIGALRFLATEADVAVVSGVLVQANSGDERDKAELALLTLCSRGREKCAGAIAAAMAGADVSSRAALLRALARAGGSAALEAASARLADSDASIRDEAVRTLAYWPDAAATPLLAKIATADGSTPRQRVLANRGLARFGDARASGPLAPAAVASSPSTGATSQAKQRPTGLANLAAMAVELPAPAFRGTPVPLNEPNVEKPSGKPRAAFFAPRGTVNLARGRRVRSSDAAPTAGELDFLTDGRKEASDFCLLEMRPGTHWVQIDLGVRATIYAVLLWHNHAEARVYRDVIVQVSDDPDFLEAYTVFNNDDDNSSGQGVGKQRGYVETSEGKLIDAKGVEGRYIRAYSKGNHVDPKNHYTEIEVFGRPIE